MIGGDGVTPSEVSDGSGYLEDAVIGAGTEVQISHGVLEEFVTTIIESAMLLELGMAHACIAGCALGCP